MSLSRPDDSTATRLNSPTEQGHRQTLNIKRKEREKEKQSSGTPGLKGYCNCVAIFISSAGGGVVRGGGGGGGGGVCTGEQEELTVGIISILMAFPSPEEGAGPTAPTLCWAPDSCSRIPIQRGLPPRQVDLLWCVTDRWEDR